MAIAVEDIVNAALVRISYPLMIGSIQEGSVAARAALNIYGQTRDKLFADFDWPFARQAVNLGNPIKTAPPTGYGGGAWNPATMPPPPWIYEYSYPANCINVRSVRPMPIFIPEQMPRVNIFAQVYDAQLGEKVLVTNLAAAQAVITARVTDPNEWQDSDFTEALIEALAVRLGKSLPMDPQRLAIEQRDAAVAQAQAMTLP